MRQSKFLVMALLALLLIAILPACSPGTPSTPAAPPATSKPAAAPSAAAPATSSQPAAPPAASKPAAPASPAAPAGKVIELSFSSVNPPTHPDLVQAFQPWAAEINKRTEGRVKVTIYPSEALGKITEQYDLVVKNAAQMSLIALPQYPGRFPLADVFNLPFLIPPDTIDQKSVGIRNMVYDKYLTPAYLKDVQLIITGRFAPSQLHLAKKPVRSLEDLKGLVLGFPGGSTYASLIKALGAAPELSPVSEMYNSLSRGVIDGQFQAWQTQSSFKLADVTKYVTVVNGALASDLVIMNKQAWAGLPPDVQKIFNDLNQMLIDSRFKVALGADKLGQDTAAKANVQAIELSAAERQRWVDAGKPSEKQWFADMDAKGLPGTAMYNDILAMLK